MEASKVKDLKIVTDRAHFGGLITLSVKEVQTPNKLYLNKDHEKMLLLEHEQIKLKNHHS